MRKYTSKFDCPLLWFTTIQNVLTSLTEVYTTSSDEQQSFLRPMIIYGTKKRNVHGISKNHPVYP